MNLNFEHINSAIEQLDTWREVSIYMKGSEYMGCYAGVSDVDLEILNDYARISHYQVMSESKSFPAVHQLTIHGVE